MFGKTNSSSILNASVTKGVSLTHENASNSNPVINNNISINNSDIVSEPRDKQVNEKNGIKPIDEPSSPPSFSSEDINIKAIQSENLFLKAILQIYINQKLYFNGKYIVCTPSELIELIKLLTGGDVEIETEAIEVSCLGNPKLPYSKIINIWVQKDGQRSIFKYIYSHFLSLFDECKISLKVVRVI